MENKNYTTVLVLLYLALATTNAFHVAGPSLIVGRRQTSSSIVSTLQQQHKKRNRIQRFAGDKDDLSNEPGMEDAFRELEALSSLGPDEKARPTEKPKEKDEAFAKAMEGLDLKDVLSGVEGDSTATPESELDIYRDMAMELDAASSEEDLIVADFKSDLEMAGDDDDTGVPTIDTQKFMDKAIDEALKEAKAQNKDVDVEGAKESFLDNKELMSEITKIFDKANDELLAELEEIRVEQELLAKEQAERNSQANQEKTEDYEQRMVAAQSNMRKMLDRVNEETQAVEDAIEDLRRAQAETEGGIDSQLVDLKSGGLVKQATLAGALLFTLRSGIETIGFLGGDPSHAVPALIQGVIAIACIAAFIFL